MADLNTGLFIASVVAKAAGKSKRYKIQPDGTIVFKLHAAVGVYSFIGTLGTAALAFIPDITGMLLMVGMIGPLFVPYFLYYLFARIYISDEKIVYRNLAGRRREIAWKDLNAAVSVGVFGDHMLYGGGETIRLFPYFSGFPVVLDLIRQYRPEAFDPEYALAHASEFRQQGTRGHVFRWFKGFRTAGLIIIWYGCVIMLMPTDYNQLGIKLALISVFLIIGLMFFLPCLTMRLYIDDEKIMYRNVFAVTKQAHWDDVSSYRSYRLDQGGFNRGCIQIFCRDKKIITISPGFVGRDMIEHLVSENGKQRRIKFW